MRGRSIKLFFLEIAIFFLDERAIGLDIILSNKDGVDISYRKYRSIDSKNSVLTRF
jgi:hypothetical protein